MQCISMLENNCLDSTESTSSYLSSVSSIIVTTRLKLPTFTSLLRGGGVVGEGRGRRGGGKGGVGADFVVVFRNIFCL